MAYLGHYRRTTIIAYVSLMIASLAQLAVPRLVGNITDSIRDGVIPPAAGGIGPSRAEDAIIAAGIAIIAFAVARGVFSFAQSYMAEMLSQNIAFDFRNELFAKIQHLSFSYHDSNQTGQLMIRATDDVERVRLFAGQGLLMTMQAVVLLVGTLIILVTTNWRLTLVILPILPLAVLMFGIFGALSAPLFGELQKRLSNLNTILQENLAGIRIVKAFAREGYEQGRFEESADFHLQQHLRISAIFAALFPMIFLISNIGQAAVLYAGGNQIVDGTLTLGQWQEFSLYLAYVFFPLGSLGFIITLMSQAAASSERIFEILDAKNEVEDKPGALELDTAQGEVVFDNVAFRYFSHGNYVLQNVSLRAEPGQTVALLGATGSGKTTIINLLPRFYDVSEGSVQIDGHDVRDLTLNSLRSHIGIVLQETTLFTGTIRDNIAFGRPDASLDDVIQVAQAAAAHDFIMSFPDGYDTSVGERGTTLSGGQKQRIAIARALLLNPQILILDDSTSSVDLTTEYQIQQALDSLMQNRTSFVIAQRISTVLNADQILVLDRGQIVARGTHEELMEDSPIYVEIYNSQLVEDAALDDEPAAEEVANV